MLCIVSFLHVLEAIIIDVTSVAGIGDIRSTECQPIRHIHVKNSGAKGLIWLLLYGVGYHFYVDKFNREW